MATLVNDISELYPQQASSGATGEDYLKSLPTQQANLIRAYSAGKMPLSPMMVRTPAGMSLLSAISQYDPTFDATNYGARAKLRSDFTSGKSAQNLNAFNTVLEHLGELQSSYNDLGNTGIPLVNKVKNWAEDAAGVAAPNTFDLNKKAVVDELTRAWRGSGGSEGDIQSWSKVLSNAQSPDQFNGAMQKVSGLLKGKIDAMQNQYQEGMGGAANDSSPAWLTPKSQKALDALSNGTDAPKAPVIPKAAINDLKMNPKLASQFDAKFGTGASAQILGK